MEASYCHFYVTKMTNLIRKKGKPKVFDMINQVRPTMRKDLLNNVLRLWAGIFLPNFVKI